MFTPEEIGEILFCLRQTRSKKVRELAKGNEHQVKVAERIERIDNITRKLRGLRKVHPVFS